MTSGPITTDRISSPISRRRSRRSRAVLTMTTATATQIATARAAIPYVSTTPPTPISPHASNTAMILNSIRGFSRGEEPGGDLQGDRPAQLELPVSGGRGADEPVRGRALGLGDDPGAAGGPRRSDRHRPLSHRLFPRYGRRWAGDRRGGR